ncbi:PREDICTED: wall-associated receptor kinase-like 15 [Nelumbo nucifera]|uniref:Wall-associated receptor kinase-like 15 n=1 Tax=Nelumbo nucifera TaxID=4432 RepID=A0A1U8Q8X3_NELNU|nr:PREDICTED: wall-associated receptor kinase-like 15 [Nelumbo nucifera]
MEEGHPVFPTNTIHLLLLLIIITLLLFSSRPGVLALQPSCQNKCGSLPVNYPLGTGYGCGSPRFYPHISCSPGGDQLLFTTHTGSYPITSISYATSTIIITPPRMSTCSSMHSSPNLGLDWPSPFQLGPSVFILLSCPPPTSSLTVKGIPICDSTNAHLCASMHTCPALLSLGLSLFSPTNTCCVYSPANLDTKGDLDLHALKCATYASVVSLGDFPTDPSRWEYGVALTYSNQVAFDNNNYVTSCEACQNTDGVCGYAPPRNNFVCVCKNGVNTTTDCYNQLQLWNSASLLKLNSMIWAMSWLIPLSLLAVA